MLHNVELWASVSSQLNQWTERQYSDEHLWYICKGIYYSRLITIKSSQISLCKLMDQKQMCLKSSVSECASAAASTESVE